LSAEAWRPAFGDISQYLGNCRAIGAVEVAARATKPLKTQERRRLARSVLKHGHEARGAAREREMELRMERAPSVFTRDDTFFGVCEALGEDLRIPPTLLRIGFALALFFNPIAAVGAYLGLGLFVAALRWFVPNPSVELPVEAEEAGQEAIAAPAEAEEEEEGLPIAA
jgi:phage shock protein PspC (stress-responsive transcriptional regulator)